MFVYKKEGINKQMKNKIRVWLNELMKIKGKEKSLDVLTTIYVSVQYIVNNSKIQVSKAEKPSFRFV